MRFRLRTLLILMAIVPPLVAIGWWAVASEEAASVIGAVAFSVIAVWLASRCVISLNTRM